MEDAHVCIDSLPNNPSISFYGVYDGHGGSEAAHETEKVLHTEIVSHPNFPQGLPDLFVDTFASADKQIIATGKSSGMTTPSSPYQAGSTVQLLLWELLLGTSCS